MVFRHEQNRKWFALLMSIPGSKLGSRGTNRGYPKPQMRSSSHRLPSPGARLLSRLSHEQGNLDYGGAGRQRGGGENQTAAPYEFLFDRAKEWMLLWRYSVMDLQEKAEGKSNQVVFQCKKNRRGSPRRFFCSCGLIRSAKRAAPAWKGAKQPHPMDRRCPQMGDGKPGYPRFFASKYLSNSAWHASRSICSTESNGCFSGCSSMSYRSLSWKPLIRASCRLQP